MYKPVKNLGDILRSSISDNDSQNQEAEVLQREADRLRRDAERMLRESERLTEMSIDDNATIAEEAKRLAEEAHVADTETSHIGGVNNLTMQLLANNKTSLDENIKAFANWNWPSVHKELIEQLNTDHLIISENEINLIKDETGMYINGMLLKPTKAKAYQSIFKNYDVLLSSVYSFHKKDSNIVLINSDGDIMSFFSMAKNEGLISSIKEPIRFEINGLSAFKNSEKLNISELELINKIAKENNIVPVPGKTIEIVKKGYKMGYTIDGNTHFGTWIAE